MQEALQVAQDLASKAEHSQIDNEHFMVALLNQSEGIVRPLLENVHAELAAKIRGVDAARLEQ